MAVFSRTSGTFAQISASETAAKGTTSCRLPAVHFVARHFQYYFSHAGKTTVSTLVPKNDSDGCLQGCYNGDCGPGTNNYLSLASVCDERLSQLWLMSTDNRQLINAASGRCISVTSDDVVTLAACGNDSPAQTWTLYANGSLEPQSDPGRFMTVCRSEAAGCDPKIMSLISADGEMITIAADTDDAAFHGWEMLAPSEDSCHLWYT